MGENFIFAAVRGFTGPDGKAEEYVDLKTVSSRACSSRQKANYADKRTTEKGGTPEVIKRVGRFYLVEKPSEK